MNTLLFLTLVVLIGFAQATMASNDHQDPHKDSHKDSHKKDPHDDKHNDHDEHGEQGHSEKGTTTISDDMAAQVGLITATVGAQSLHQTISVFGRLTTGPEQTSHVRARFPGVIESVNVSIGDTVTTGDLLAVIESNKSLKPYELRAPISGVVTQRHANIGEVTQAQVLFSLVNRESLWAELRIFPSQTASIAAGQTVHIMLGNSRAKTTLLHLLPAEPVAPYLIARAKIDGSSTVFFPGMMVEGRIVVGEFDVPMALSNNALHTMAGQTGVFVKHNNNYTFTPVVTGQADASFTQVLSGVALGAQYATQSSYLIKADIEKSEAKHEH